MESTSLLTTGMKSNENKKNFQKKDWLGDEFDNQ